MKEKLTDAYSYPPKAMRLEQAARYLDISTSTFLRLVDDGELPTPTRKNGIVSWDRLDLDAAYENWKTTSSGNSIEKLLRQAMHGVKRKYLQRLKSGQIYFRVGGKTRARLPDDELSPEFATQYNTLVAALRAGQFGDQPSRVGRPVKGTARRALTKTVMASNATSRRRLAGLPSSGWHLISLPRPIKRSHRTAFP